MTLNRTSIEKIEKKTWLYHKVLVDQWLIITWEQEAVSDRRHLMIQEHIKFMKIISSQCYIVPSSESITIILNMWKWNVFKGVIL